MLCPIGIGQQRPFVAPCIYILMLSVVAFVVNNYILLPYLSLFTNKVVILELPEKMWNLMSIGVGGYVVGRSAEKVVTGWKKNV